MIIDIFFWKWLNKKGHVESFQVNKKAFQFLSQSVNH